MLFFMIMETLCGMKIKAIRSLLVIFQMILLLEVAVMRLLTYYGLAAQKQETLHFHCLSRIQLKA